jgi:hypothetical protein
LLPKLSGDAKKSGNRFQKEIEQLQILQQQEHTKVEEDSAPVDGGTASDGGPAFYDVVASRKGVFSGLVFDADAPDGAFDADAPDGDFDADAPDGAFDADAPDGAFDADAPQADDDQEEKREKSASRLTPEEVTGMFNIMIENGLLPRFPNTTEQHHAELQHNVQQDAIANRMRREADRQAEHSATWFWLSDPILHAIIVVLAVICFLLGRKIMELLEDLEALK